MGTYTSRSNTIEEKENYSLEENIKRIKESEDYSENMKRTLIALVIAEKKEAEKKEAEAKKIAEKETTEKEAIVRENLSEEEKFHRIKDYISSLLRHPELEEEDKLELDKLINLMAQLDEEVKKINKSPKEKDNVYYFANEALLKIEFVGVSNTAKEILRIFQAVKQERAKQELNSNVQATFLENGESFGAHPNLTSQGNHSEKTGTAVENTHAQFHLSGHSAAEYAFHETICKLEEMREASKDDKERSAIGELIEVMLDFDEQIQEQTGLNNSTKKIQEDIPPQSKDKRESIYSSANDALKDVLNPLAEKFAHAVQTAKSSIQKLINSVANLFKDQRVSLSNRNCHFSPVNSTKSPEATPPARRNSI